MNDETLERYGVTFGSAGNSEGQCVKVLTHKAIRLLAQHSRNAWGLGKGRIDPLRFLDLMKIKWRESQMLWYEVVDDLHMQGAEALFDPYKKCIKIRASIYDGACKDDPYCRQVLCHEIGHWLMHEDQARFAYAARGTVFGYMQDAEWQADIFAEEFLADLRGISINDTVSDVMEKFCVTRQCAEYRVKELQKVSFNTEPSQMTLF